MRRLLCLAILFALSLAPTLAADELSLAPRFGQPETAVQTLPTESPSARDGLVPLPPVHEATPVSWNEDIAEQSSSLTPAQAQQMMDATAKKYAWRKGDFTITPYGFLWGNMVYETEQSYVGSYALWIRSAQTAGNDNFVLDGRNTRLGIDVAGPRLWLFDCAPSGGKAEIDFQGSFVTENKGSLLLRHAYWEVKNEDFRILMGQTWDVISPLVPSTTMYSVYWCAGNIGYRRAQLRGERYLKFSPVSMLTLQGSLNVDIVSDFTSPDDDIEGDHGGWPVIESRAAWTLGQRGPGCLPVTVGASGHIGNQDFAFGPHSPLLGEYVRRTWSLNADFQVPITHRFGVQGEFFTGENLGAFLGGIAQGVDPNTAEGICSTGGWVEVWYDLSCCWHSHTGFTIDDPFDSDITSASGRVYNSAYYTNLIYDVTKQFQLGVEISSWKTLYKAQEPGEAFRIEFMGKYGF